MEEVNERNMVLGRVHVHCAPLGTGSLISGRTHLDTATQEECAGSLTLCVVLNRKEVHRRLLPGLRHGTEGVSGMII